MKSPVVIENDNFKDPTTIEGWVDKISMRWNSTVAGILDVSRMVQRAYEIYDGNLTDRIRLEKMLSERGISTSTIAKLKKIGQSDHFTVEQQTYLPASYNYLYELAKMEQPEYNKVVTKLSQGLEYKDAAQVLRKKKKKNLIQHKALFTLTADVERVTRADLNSIQEFVDDLSRKKVIKIRKTPAYNKLISDQE